MGHPRWLGVVRPVVLHASPRSPFDFAQGRLSTSLAVLRFGRDDRFWEFERSVVGAAVNREKLREWGHCGATVGDIKRAMLSHWYISY